MPNIGIYDKYAIKWGYKPILDVKAEDEKSVLNQWIMEHDGDPMYRFGHQQVGDIHDPSSQTEDLGDDAIKASMYGIANLKRIVPKLMEWTTKDGENYDELQTMYGQVLSQFNRYTGHVANNIGGVYEYHKTADQEGAVYTHVPKAHQQKAMKFLNEQLFATPEWMLDQDILNKIEYSGSVERIRALQESRLKTVLALGKLARAIENQTLNGKDAYSITDIMGDLRKGIWAETTSGKAIDTYRRNLQKAHIDQLAYLMTADSQRKLPDFGGYRKSTPINTSQSDIRSVARGELNNLKRAIRNGLARTGDTMSRYHYQDALERIDQILNPIT